MSPRRLAFLAGLLVVVAVGLGAVAWWWLRPPPPPAEPRLVLTAARYADLPGWSEDDPRPALAAFARSCARLADRPAEEPLGREPSFGRVAEWRAACAALAGPWASAADARARIEAVLRPWLASDRGQSEGLVTGYFEPVLEGSRRPDARFRHALHRRPDDLVTVELGRFDPTLEGRRIAGRVEKGRLVPYFTRAEIDAGALAGRGLELAWVADPVALFFLHVQGSGRIALAEGGTLRVGYADQNGHPYRAIGRDLVEMGALTREAVSLQSIRAWLAAHPERTFELLHKNPSYVFFRELALPEDAPGPPGAQGVPLTPGRSLAVDRRFVPLGVPLWLDTTAPAPEGERPLRRLVVAQDVGGAIRGPVRGDVFWGSGPEAEYTAGHMKSRGRYWLLLPAALDPTGGS
ncbi:MAG: MltA domain-containing protein [Geminicoccaceae bacterium]|nr:MltA domain-containing protein [Geminicoccaceae bacterium]